MGNMAGSGCFNNSSLQIEEAKTKNSNLIAKKENVNSKEFIEEIARDKLDMYLPNERVYIDIGK